MNPVSPVDLVVARRIMAARIAAELRPRQLARAAHLQPNVVGAIEDGHRAATDAEIAALAGALGVTPDELLVGVAA